MALAPQVELPATLDGLAEYLRSCPSVGMALAIGAELRNVTEAEPGRGSTQLSPEVLGKIRSRLFDRPSNPESSADDAFGLLIGALNGTGSRSNTLEANIRFVEELQRQLGASERVNYQRAYATATRW